VCTAVEGLRGLSGNLLTGLHRRIRSGRQASRWFSSISELHSEQLNALVLSHLSGLSR